MNMLRKVLLGVALMTGAMGSVLLTPTQAQAAIFAAYSHAFLTFAEADAYRVASLPVSFGQPTFVQFLQFGPNGPGFYVCVDN
jgi:hypothetical protein